MKQTISSYTLADQRGVAMVFELVLVAAVLVLVGLAVYQTGHHAKTASVVTSPTPPPNSPQGIANAAGTAALQDSASDASLSASAESATDELSSSDQDVTNLGDSSNASF